MGYWHTIKINVLCVSYWFNIILPYLTFLKVDLEFYETYSIILMLL